MHAFDFIPKIPPVARSIHIDRQDAQLISLPLERDFLGAIATSAAQGSLSLYSLPTEITAVLSQRRDRYESDGRPASRRDP